MKNMKKILILALILSALLCMNVFAAEIGTITDPVTGNPIAAEKATILEKEVAGEQQKVAVKFTQSGVTKDNMYLVLILAADANGEAPLRPTDSNILYVNQATAESDTITFDNLYPSEVKESYIFLAGADVDYSKPLAKINPLKPAFLFGDVDNSGKVENKDSMIMARYFAGWDGYEAMILSWDNADVDQNGKVENKDSMIMARYFAGWDGYEDYFLGGNND